jgi:hypothetical protein
MLRKIELGRGLDVQLSEKKSLDDNHAPVLAVRPSGRPSLAEPVVRLFIVTSSASLIFPIACFAFFAKNASHFGQIELTRPFLLFCHKMWRAKAKDGVVGRSKAAYSDKEDYE